MPCDNRATSHANAKPAEMMHSSTAASEAPLTFHEQQMLQGGFQFTKKYCRKRTRKHRIGMNGKNRRHCAADGKDANGNVALSQDSNSKKMPFSFEHQNTFDMARLEKKLHQYLRDYFDSSGQKDAFGAFFSRDLRGKLLMESCLRDEVEGGDASSTSPPMASSNNTTQTQSGTLPSHMYIYGIGDLYSDASIFQLACAVSMLRSKCCVDTVEEVYLSDPMIIMDNTEESLQPLRDALLKEYGIKFLSHNDECCNLLPSDAPSIVYMPHCPNSLYLNLLKTNWKHMDNLILVGNHLPLPDDVIQDSWDFTTFFGNLSQSDVSRFGLNNTSVYLLKSGNDAQFQQFKDQFEDSCRGGHYITKTMCSQL